MCTYNEAGSSDKINANRQFDEMKNFKCNKKYKRSLPKKIDKLK